MLKSSIFLAIVASFLLISCSSVNQNLQTENEKLQLENEKLTTELQQAQQVISDQKTAIAKFNTGGLEAQRTELDRRDVELDRREKDLILREQQVAQNLKEVGQAEQIRQEYDAMKAARDKAENDISRLWMYIFGISAFTALSIIVSVILIVRYWIRLKQHEQAIENERSRREQVIKVMEKIPPSSITPEVVRGLIGLPPNDISKQLVGLEQPKEQ